MSGFHTNLVRVVTNSTATNDITPIFAVLSVTNIAIVTTSSSITPPSYAILSHTWGHEEVTFQDYLLTTGPHANRHAHIRKKAGFPKIVGACKRAHADGLQYLWCDTNCIDKSSSAELSEAINSMYAWYRDSVVCYAYLADVDAGAVAHVGPGASIGLGQFKNSRWFTRGWTLQELLAPKKVVFFDRQWRVFGNRDELAQTICDITRIHIPVLRDQNKVPEYSIAQRMSWAADRETSRVEDIAYCLLGIFDINMPLLYGEGVKSFMRLQREIIKVSDDQSILAWNLLGGRTERLTGALARTPSCFRFCGSVVRDPDITRLPFAITNMGLTMKLPRIHTMMGGLFLVGLNCSHELRGRYVTDSRGHVGPHTYRHFRVFIWLWGVGRDVFELVHMPEYMPILDNSYVLAMQHTVTNLVIDTQLAPLNQINASEGAGRTYHDPFSAGVSICLGAGRVDPRTRLYGQATLISVAWNGGGFALKSLHTTFHDPDRQVSRKLLLQENLTCLDDSNDPGETSDRDLHTRIHELHQNVRSQVENTMPKPVVADPPLVFADKDKLDDLHGQERILITVIFQHEFSMVQAFDMARQLR
ncbi:hypothetical protein NUW58_g5092 [Xylaria curta]|uniref:Uncharacterized protein n=1 Tax=Xylaria curta TaxID=42375 RepID=A0ACC1P3G4_9PEZI|nr:hypothetical protein NUW58_g5092 [Xylaria curta]